MHTVRRRELINKTPQHTSSTSVIGMIKYLSVSPPRELSLTSPIQIRLLKLTFEGVLASLPWYFHQFSTHTQLTPISMDSSHEQWISTLVLSSNNSANVQTPVRVLIMWRYFRSREFDLSPNNLRKHETEVVVIVSRKRDIVKRVLTLCDKYL